MPALMRAPMPAPVRVTDMPYAAESPAPVFAQAVEAILAEAERHAAWLNELETEVTAARIRRDQLAVSLEGLFRALGPQTARAYAPRLAAITGPAPERPVGNLSPDGRLAALKSILSDWPAETISPTPPRRRCTPAVFRCRTTTPSTASGA